MSDRVVDKPLISWEESLTLVIGTRFADIYDFPFSSLEKSRNYRMKLWDSDKTAMLVEETA